MVFQGVELSLPPSFFFNTPPADDPQTLLPPSDEQTFRSPFAVDPDFYHWTYSAHLPIAFSIAYFAIVTICNAVNRKRGNKPTAIAKWRVFQDFVLLHNLALAIYSGVTCVALWRAIFTSVPSVFGPNGLPATVDGLCKMHGPRGYGDAVVYDPTQLRWKATNVGVRLAPDGILPDSTDVGRIWNEGLAFWGWLFYLSKYYEVVDTIIILLKGKRATTLQKYHHAGALLCMWAGMRYMSPPIWMFVGVNSGIHTLMYTFYTASTLNIRVPGAIKKTITTLQILQFLVGASFAAVHLFVSYRIPISTPVQALSVASAMTQAIPATASSLFSTVKSDSYEHKIPPWMKRLLYRAAGAEGLAETVTDFRAGARLDQLVSPKPVTEPVLGFTRVRRHFETVRCLDTNGEAFAVWLNVLYLTPLTLLFLRFFWKSYILGKKSKKQPETPEKKEPRRLSVSAIDAARRTSESFEEYGTEFEKSIGFGDHVSTKKRGSTAVTETAHANGSIESTENISKDWNSGFKKSTTVDTVNGVEARTEIVQQLKRSVSTTSNGSRTSIGNSVVKTPSKTNKGPGFSEQEWFGGRDSPSS